MRKIAIDLGYGYVKGIADNGRTTLFPAVVGPVAKRALAELLPKANVKPVDEGLHIATHGADGIWTEYFVGELAQRESRIVSAIFDDDKVQHPAATAMLAAALTQLTDPTDTELLLVTGLPLGQYAVYKDRFEKFLRGLSIDARVYSRDGSFTTRHFRDITAHVLPQGAGAAYDILMRNRTAITWGANSLVGVIDIGHKTTDIIVFDVAAPDKNGVPGLRPVDSLSFSINTGMSVLHEQIGAIYQERVEYIPRPIDIEQMVIGGGHRVVFGSTLDFSAEIRITANSLAEYIRSLAIERWNARMADFSAVFLAGGGASLLHDQLRRLHKNIKVVVADDAQFANARGYLAVATGLAALATRNNVTQIQRNPIANERI